MFVSKFALLSIASASLFAGTVVSSSTETIVGSPMNVPIPDNGLSLEQYAVVQFDFPDMTCVVEDVDITLAIQHTFVGDLSMTLTGEFSSGDETAGLVERPGLDSADGCCGSGTDLLANTPITFDDSSVNDPETELNNYPASTEFKSAGGFLGPPVPAGDKTLSDFNGLTATASGVWTFIVSDGASIDVGDVIQATLKVTCEEDHTGGGGDPHFTTWSKEHFDFQGECDLVLIDNSSFMEGTGLTVHGRTKLHGTWSAFASAAIKIGDDVLEVHGSDPAIINGKPHQVPDIKYGTEYAYTTSVGGYSVTVQHLGPHSHRHIIHFGNGEKMFINNFKEFVDFEVESPRSTEFAGSVGLLGSYNTGTKLARDGKTVIDDADEFGQEWQVIDTDTQLFSVVEGPQYPDKCNMPVKLSAEQRHLRAMSKKVSEDDAKTACAKAPASHMQNCIADVFGSDNLDMAGIYFVH